MYLTLLKLVYSKKIVYSFHNDLKKLIKYTGDPKWFLVPANSKASQDIFKVKNWLSKATVDATQHGDMLPFKPEENWLDGGQCTIGVGEHTVTLRLYVDLGSTCTFSTYHLYPKLKHLAVTGALGAARVANEISPVDADAFDGRKVKLRRWLQLPGGSVRRDSQALPASSLQPGRPG